MGRLSIGVVLSVNFLSDYFTQAPVFNLLDPTGNSGAGYSSGTGKRSFLVGLTAEFRVSHGWSVEGDAIYRPMRSQFVNTSVINGPILRYSAE